MNGPNGAGGRGGRNFSAPHSAPNARLMDQPMPSPTASRPSESHAAFQPPQRPSRNTSFDLRNQAPQPDQRQQQSQPFAPAPPTPTHDLVGMNPERLKLFTDMGVTNTGPPQASPTTAPPSGPRGTAGRAPTNAPTGPSPATTAPPSGPSSAIDRQRSTRQRGVINSVMQSTAVNSGQTSRGQDVSFRGASSRQNSFAAPPSMNGTPAAAIASEMEASQRRNDAPQRNDGLSRNDGAPRNDGPFRNDAYQNRVEPRQDQNLQGQQPRDDGRARHRNEERPRGSRHASSERRPDDEPPQRPPPVGMDDRRARDDRERAPRDRRGPPRGDENRRPPDMPGSMGGPPPPTFPRGGYGPGPQGQGPDNGRRGGDAMHGDQRGGRRDEERRNDGGHGMPRDDGPSDRKRRHEDPQFGSDKRRRSGR
ncbi:THO2 plays a role in transcriptional elongation [Elasticomyces elasticus]|nr:THO2 plays a role in transcriptional elongation [Elasticomyces elasticus]